MKIKNLFLMMSGLALAAGAVSCSDISEEDRYIPVEMEKAARMVLLEEFTGQNCTNCPKGHEAVHNILEAYPDGFIPVSIHASSLSFSEAEGGLGIPEGAEYFMHYNQPSLPAGVVNRSSGVKDRTEWAAEVGNLVAVPTPLVFNLTATLNDDKSAFDINVKMVSSQALAGKLQLWITEDKISMLQNDNGSYIWDYEHNHVLRAVVNGTWGEDVALEPFQLVETNYTQPVKNIWNADNLTVVAFYYNDGGVVNAARFNLNGDNPEAPALPGLGDEE